MVFPAEAVWKSLAPSCGLLCSELTEVLVPCCISGIFLPYSEKLVLTSSIFNVRFSGALYFFALGKFCGCGRGQAGV